MVRIAISYRRADSSAICRAIYDRLVQRFGSGSVFIDLDQIPLGENFHEYVGSALKAADVLLVLVGPSFCGPRNDLPTRIHDVDDPVRMELETAAAAGTAVLPVLVHRARMPVKSDLPEDLQWFPALNAAEVDEGRDFDSHIAALIEAVERHAKLANVRRPRAKRNSVLLDLPDEFPRNNLPPQLTSFVDRENVLAEIKELLRLHRLVTVVGAGGAGKTRCAIKIAAEMLEDTGDGVWLAQLAPISESSLVSSVIARALSVHESPKRPMLDAVLAYLKRKHLLLILDNCEHVLDEARRVAAAILQGCPDVRILATSRESFGIAGEQVYQVPSLSVPSSSESLSTEEMSHYAAVQLFSDRAISVDNRFTLTVENTPHVVDICRRLDGIPLAIELAAARVKVLTPHQLANKLDERFRVLTGGDCSALPHHRTMRALIDWSYYLLSDNERAMFRRLSIFAGGFTLETAAAACSDGEPDEIVVFDLISSLVDKSLVQAEVVRGDPRYQLLESTRQYACEKLREAGEEVTTAHAHARAFLELAKQIDDAWETTPDRAWYTKADGELENFRAALSWTFGARGDVLLGQNLAGVLRRVWSSFGPAEGRRWVHAAQERVSADTPTAVLAALDLAEASFATVLGHYKASRAASERALAGDRELADPRGIAAAEAQIGRAQLYLGKISEGEALLRRALEEVRSLGARRSVIIVIESLALARHFAGDLPGARQRFREALAAARAVGAERWAAVFAMNLAEAEFRGGNVDEALRLSDDALVAVRALGDTQHVATAGYNMAAYLVALRRYDEARATAREAVSAARDMQWSVGVAFTLQHLAAIAALRTSADVPVEDHQRAARILGYVDARLDALEALREYTEQQEYDAMIPALRDEIGEDKLTKLMTEGSSWDEDQAVAEAMLI